MGNMWELEAAFDAFNREHGFDASNLIDLIQGRPTHRERELSAALSQIQNEIRNLSRSEWELRV
jgi:hypothetical protein